MRALLMAIGTRGDAEPFLALAVMLKNAGWETSCVFPEQFRVMVENEGINFHGFDKRFLELLEGQTGIALMGGSGNFIHRFKAMRSLARSSWKLQDRLLKTQQNCIADFGPDLVFYHPKCVYPILWEIAHPGHTTMVCPMPCLVHEVKEYATMGLTGNGNFGPFLNRLSYKLVNWIRTLVFYKMSRKYAAKLGSAKVTRNILYKTLVQSTRTFYSISPSLFPRPDYWAQNLHVTGFVERNKITNWKPSIELVNFLSRYDKILLVSFGSMKNEDPVAKTKALLTVLGQHKIPAIINISWGGLQKVEDHTGMIHFVDSIPYDWILPKVYAMVHHGGSGTTHAACKYGCPSLIIPHIVDQYFWNRRISDLGLGPKGIPVKRLTSTSVEAPLLDLWNNPEYKQEALRIQQKMSTEGSEKELLQLITDAI